MLAKAAWLCWVLGQSELSRRPGLPGGRVAGRRGRRGGGHTEGSPTGASRILGLSFANQGGEFILKEDREGIGAAQKLAF